MKKQGHNLQKIIECSDRLQTIQKSDLQFGDKLFIYTRNSTYSILILNENYCLVSGGWFDRKGLSPMKTTIAGCTWGGSIIKIDIVAARGLCLEFGNRVVTTAIRKFYIKRNGYQN
ncbi:MAG: hypothetical protein ACE5GL_06120 [Calditrichia bacterium]